MLIKQMLLSYKNYKVEKNKELLKVIYDIIANLINLFLFLTNSQCSIREC